MTCKLSGAEGQKKEWGMPHEEAQKKLGLEASSWVQTNIK
eukprot:CAMPEP_0194695700 /NCGR_PEP_ID=MMETSP0295-20121207/22154_1 /TAXON_ID=39354 /ORGANISM="Heterosigma akashiwo, Strain CCMP2393" /LENGTH=39 /DNA_ID= /DNA_START= /DNA_END= /DNA_ORIENTATION=